MILLLGKNNAILRYAKEILNVDVGDNLVYYPSITTHYTEIPRYASLAKEENPPIITTQNLELIEVLLNSDLDFKVITAYEGIGGTIKGRILTKAEAIYVKNKLGLELR